MSWKTSVPESEHYTYDYFLLDSVCRLCWGADGIIELSSYNPKSIENDATIAEKIKECIGIDVTHHAHPKKICSKCLDEIDIFSEFKKFCQETDHRLHIIIENGLASQKIMSQEVSKKRKLDDLMILKEESDVEFSHIGIGIDESIDDLFDDLPLSCEVSGNVDRLPKKERKKRSANYCNFCHTNLESSVKLTQHNLDCHGIEENGLYKCFGCEKRFKSTKKRLRHESDTCKGLKCGYKCDICDRFLPKRRVYENHMRAHRENKEIDFPEDSYKCNKCLQTFKKIETLRKHMLTHYQKEKKTYVCDICGRVFSRRDYLYKHKLVHEGSKLQKCPYCEYSAVQRSSLTVHIRKHTGERPYPCDLCSHRCVTSSNLREHRKRHFGIKAFECKLCDKKFGYKISLEEHMSAVHERSETHACVQCGATYSRFRGLRRHLLAKHGKKVKKVKDYLIELENGHVEDPNNRIDDLSNRIEVKNNEAVQTKAKVTFEMKCQTNVAVIENTDGAVYMTRLI